MAVARKVAALVFVLVAAAFSGAAGAAERLLGWPCQVPFAAKIEPAAVWPAPPPVRLDGAWRQRERVVRLTGNRSRRFLQLTSRRFTKVCLHSSNSIFQSAELR